MTQHRTDNQDSTLLFTGQGKRRITKALLAAYFWTHAGLGVMATAYAQPAPMPIADPRAPMAFQPSIQSVPGGAPVINITTPNAAGLSLNQYQQFDVPTSGVVLNNSQIGGTPLLGGSVSANPHLTGGTANTIVNEVTVQGSPSQINGTIEVFGNPAAVIVANPNGVTCNGCGIVNAPRLSFSTGSITLQDVNGSSSNFDLASGIGYNVQGGQVSIQGTGIEGTVGQIDLIGELLRVNAPLRAHYLNQGISSINLTTGKTPGAPALTANATGSTAAGAGSAVAIDASALGAMTAGRITVVSTDAGMGVNLRGPLLAYQQDVDIQSAGRVTTGDVAASRDIRINADGFVITGGTVAASENLQVSGRDGVYVAGSASANKGIKLDSAQGGVTAQGPVATAGDLNVQAAQAVRLNSSTQVAGNTSLRGDTVSIGGSFAGGKDVTINARSGAGISGDATIGGNLSMQSGGDAALVGNIQVNQSANVTGTQVTTSGNLTVGQNFDVLGTQSVDLLGGTTVGNQFNVGGGVVTLAGDLDTGQTNVSAQQLHLGGTDGNLNAQGDLNLNVSQSFHNTGNVNVSGSFGLNTNGDAQFDGTVTTGSNFGVNAGGNVAVNGAVNSGGSVNLAAGNNLSVGNTITAGGGVNGKANGDIGINGAVSSGGNVNLTAGNNLQVGNTITAGGGVNGTAGGSIAVNGQVNSAGSQNWHAQGDFTASQGLQGNNVNIQGNNVQVTGPILGTGGVQVAANNNLQLGGEVRANGNVNLSSEQGVVTAQSVFSNGSVGVISHGAIDVQTIQAADDISLNATNGQVTAQSLLAGRDLALNAQDRISVAGDVGAGRHVSIQSSQADVQLAQASAGENLTVAAAQGVQIAGKVSAGGNASLTSQSAGITVNSILANGDISSQAAGDIAVAGEIASGGNVRLSSSAGKADLGGALYGAQSVSVEGNSVQLAQGLQSGGAATVIANTGNINSDAGIAAMGDVHLQSAGGTSVTGAVQSAGNLALNSGADTRIAGDMQASQNITTQVGGVLQAANVGAGGNAALQANRIVVDDVQVAGAANLKAEQDIQVAQNLMAGTIVTNSVTGNTNIAGNVGTAGALTMASGGGLSTGNVAAGIAQGDATSINAAGSVQLASLQTGGDYTGRAGQDHVVTGDMSVQGHADVQAGGNIQAGTLSVGNGLQASAGGGIVVQGDAAVMGVAQLQSGGTQQIAGNLQATDQLISNAQGGLQVTGDLIANNGIRVDSTAGALSVGGLLGTQGAATVNAAQGVQVTGDVLANAVDLSSSNGAIQIGGNLSSQTNASLQAQQDVAIAGATAVMGNLHAASTAGSITFGNNLQVAGDFTGHANKDLNFLGDSLLLGQADLKADTGRINNQGTMTFGQAVNINTTGDLVNEGTIQSQSDITISARNVDSNVANKGGIATGANLSVTASGATRVGQEGTLSAAQDISLQSAGGTQTAGTIQAGQDLHYAGGSLSNSGTVVAQNAEINAGLANQGNVYIQNDLNVTGGSSNSGEIAAKTLTMASLDNSGKIGAQSASLGATSNAGEISADSVDISGGLSNTGSVSGGSSVSVNGGSTSNDGTIAGGSVTLAGSSITNGGQIQSSGAMSIAGGSFENRLQESKNCALPGGCTTPDTYQYSQTPGSISAGSTLNINVASASNKGVIHAGSDITINGALNNERSTNDPYTSAGANGGAVSGIISAGGNLTATGASVQNTGQMQAGNAVQITSSGAFNNAAPTEDVAGQVIGKSVKITAGTINNDGMVLAQAGNADLIATNGAISNKGTVATTGDLNLTATGAVSNSKDGKLLGNNIAIKGDTFSNAGIVYGQNAAPSKVTIQANGGFSNAVTGVVIAGEKLDIKAGGYSNAGGTVGSLQDASLTMAGTYAPTGNALVALGKLNLQVGGISVGVGQSWNVGSTDVTWSGTLTNYGSVAIAGNASGSIDNLSSGNRFYSGTPNVYDGTYEVTGYPSGLTDVSVVGYTDVEHRAQLYIGGAFNGSLRNVASDSSVGGTFGLDQTNIDQTVTWEGKDADGNVVQVDTNSRTLARINTGSGTSNITLTGPNTGTIVGDGIIINGGNVTINPGIDPATGLPLVTNAQGTHVNAGNAQSGDSADTTTMHTKPALVDDPNAVGNTNVAGTNTTGAGAGAGSNGGAGDVSAEGTPVAGNGDGAAPGAPDRTLNLKDPIFQTPEGAVAVLMGSQFNPQWPDWNLLRVVPGSISANDLQLNLDGRFTNHGQLDVTNQLIINAAEGIDNFKASINAGGNVTLTGKYLNNDEGTINAGSVGVNVKEGITNNRGKILAKEGGVLIAGTGITAEDGEFTSDQGKLTLSAGGDINLISSKVSGNKGAELFAGGDINLLAKEKTESKSSTQDKLVTYTVSYGDTEETSQVTQKVGTTKESSTTITQSSTNVSSADGDVKIAAKGDLNIIGSNVSAKQDVMLIGNRVNIESKKELVAKGEEEHRKGYDYALYESEETLKGGEITAGRNVVISATGKPAPVIENPQSGSGTKDDPYAKKPGVVETNGAGSIKLNGATVAAGGDVSLIASGNINVLDKNVESHLFEEKYSKSSGFLSSKSTTTKTVTDISATVATQISGNNVLLQAGQIGEDGKLISGSGDINVRGSDIIASDKLMLNAGRDISITPGQGTLDEQYLEKRTNSGLSASWMTGISVGNSKSNATGNSSQTINVESRLQGGDIQMQSGRDTTIQASQVIADRDISISAGRDINITAARDRQESNYASSSQSNSIGLMPGLSPNYTILGHTSTDQDGKDKLGVGTASLLSANKGSLILNAGTDEQYKGTGHGNVTTQGADLIAQERVSITGNAVDLREVETTHESEDHMRSKSLIVGARPAGMIGAIINTADAAIQNARNGNDRLAGANALKAGYDAYKYAQNGQQAVDAAQQAVQADGGDPNKIDPNSASIGVSVSVNYGESRQDSSQSSSTKRGTNIQASNIDITAKEGDITMRGAKLQAENIALDAARDIKLEAIQNTQRIQSSNSSSSYGGGVTFGVGEQTGFSFQGNYGQNRGKANGTETVNDNTQILAGNRLSVKSGGNTELRGAQLAGKEVTVDVGGNLVIESLQDKTEYDMQQSSTGFNVSLCIPPICYGNPVTGTLTVGRTEVNHNYQSALGQSGISAGEGGYDIKVAGNTNLIGGAITSTATPDKNSLQTQSLTFSDLTNTQNTHVSASNISVGYGGGSVVSTIASNVAANVLSNTGAQAGLPDSGKETSQTQSVISPGNVVITGKDSDGSSAQAVATVTGRDPKEANGGLTNRLTLVQAQQIEENQRQAKEDLQVSNLVGSVLTGIVGDVSEGKWESGSPEKIALHGMVGAAVVALGGGNGAIGLVTGAANEWAVGIMADYLIGQGYQRGSPEFNELMKAGSAALGAMVSRFAGGSAETVAASGQLTRDATEHNYLKHDEKLKRDKAQSDCYSTGDDNACKTVANLNALDASRDKEVSDLAKNCTNDCWAVVNSINNELTALGCTGPYVCDDATLNKAKNIALTKAQRLPEGFGPDEAIFLAYGLTRGVIRVVAGIRGTGTVVVESGISGSKSNIVPGNMSSTEINQASSISSSTGGLEFVGVPKLVPGESLNGVKITGSDYPAIDGWLTLNGGSKVPVSLKGGDKNLSNPNNILNVVYDTSDKGGKYGIIGVTTYVDAPKVSAYNITAFVNNGGKAADIFLKGVVDQIVINTRDGYLSIYKNSYGNPVVKPDLPPSWVNK